MPKHYKQPFRVEKWRKIRELLYLFILFFYTILLLHDAATAFLTYDVYSWADTIAKLEQVVIPVLLIVLYLSNIIFDRSYFILKKEVIKIVLFIVCTIVSIIHTSMFTFGTLMLCADFTSIKKLAKTSALAIFWCTVIGIVACFRYAYVNDIILDRFGRQRHYFAFGHYAVWARQMLYAGILYFISKDNPITLPELGIFAVLQCAVYYYSTQRLTLRVAMLTVIVFAVFVKYRAVKIDNKIMSGLSAIAYPATMAFTLFLSLNYDEAIPFFSKLDSLLSTRIQLQSMMFDVFNVQLFAQKVKNVTDFYMYIDSGYLYMLFAYGLVLTVLLLAVFSYMFWRSCKTNNTRLFAVLILTMAYLFVDNTPCDLTCSGVVLLFFPIVLKEHLNGKKQVQF